MNASSARHIVVIGAGITGLQSSILLLEAGYKVTIIAKHLPGDSSIEYTSPWAGAQWRTHATPATPEQCQWDIETYNHWLATVEDEERQNVSFEDRSGLSLFTNTLYWDDPQHYEIKDGLAKLWWIPHVRNFAQHPHDKLPQGVCAGASFTSFAIDVPKNLAYLFRRVEDLGGVVIRASLDASKGFGLALSTAASLASEHRDGIGVATFVNATGLGAAALCGDEGMYPVRGQTVLVRGVAKGLSVRHGLEHGTGEPYIAYALPRVSTNMTVLGGCKQKGNWDPAVDEQMTAKILERCKMLCPELLDAQDEFETLGTRVGLRPGREGGARVEEESVGHRGGLWKVVHAYGHEGAGYQNSVGCAHKVVRLVGNATRRPSGSAFEI